MTAQPVVTAQPAVAVPAPAPAPAPVTVPVPVPSPVTVAVPVRDLDPGPATHAAAGGARWRLLARTAGELLLTAAAVVLLLAGYQVWGRTTLIGAQQDRLDNQLARAWGNPTVATATPVASPDPTDPLPGSAIGRLYIPRLHLRWVVVEGVAPRQIRYSPGHYPGTALPGEVGNFAVAGHREPGMFWDLDRVQAGDTLIVETRSYWYLYRVFQNQIVAPKAVEVVAPVPNRPGQRPIDRDLTLTTCNPKWDDLQRLVVHAALVSVQPHDTRPAQAWS